MKATFLIHCLLSIPLTAQVSPVALSESRDTIPAFSSSGAITLQSGRLKADIAYPRGKTERTELTVVYDPGTGYYLWHVGALDPRAPLTSVTGSRVKRIESSRAVLFSDPAGLVEVTAIGPFVKVWRQRTDSLDSAIRESTNTIRQRLANLEGGGYSRDYKYIPVFGPMPGFDAKIPAGYKAISPLAFSCEPNRAVCPGDTNTVTSISKQGNNWRLVLRNRFDLEVFLDQNFDLIGSQQLAQPKQ